MLACAADQRLNCETPIVLRTPTAEQTGPSAIPRATPEEEANLPIDPRFDPDDLRQGKAPPAARKGGVLQRASQLPGTVVGGAVGAVGGVGGAIVGGVGGVARQGGRGVKKVRKLVPVGRRKDNGEVEMKEEEVEVEVDEHGKEVGAGSSDEGGAEKHHGVMGKLFGHGHGHAHHGSKG